MTTTLSILFLYFFSVSATAAAADSWHLRKNVAFREWRIRAIGQNGAGTDSGFAWDVFRLKFFGPSGENLVGDAAPSNLSWPLHSGCAADPQHGNVSGFEPENAFRDVEQFWGGRPKVARNAMGLENKLFYIGWHFQLPVNVAKVTLEQSRGPLGHVARFIFVEARNDDADKWTSLWLLATGLGFAPLPKASVSVSPATPSVHAHAHLPDVHPEPPLSPTFDDHELIPEGALAPFWEPPLEGELPENETHVDGQPTIFIGIAAYRDPLCHETIVDALRRADFPLRLAFGVVEQSIKGDDVAPCDYTPRPCDEDPSQLLCVHAAQIRLHRVDARMAMGPTWARHRADRLYRGEYFAFQLDSHMKFIRGWDTKIIDQWRRTKNDYAVLSTYPADVRGAMDENFDARSNVTHLLCDSHFAENGLVKHGAAIDTMAKKDMVGDAPVLHPLWAAGNSFSRGHRITNVPYDCCLPMVFHGEEFSMLTRMWTHGYDIYAPAYPVLFHVYQFRAQPTFLRDNFAQWPHAGENSAKRVMAMLGVPPAGWPTEDDVLPGARYGLGTRRSLQTFLALFGYDMKKRWVRPGLCTWVIKQQMHVELTRCLRSDRRGIDYEHCVPIQALRRTHFGEAAPSGKLHRAADDDENDDIPQAAEDGVDGGVCAASVSDAVQCFENVNANEPCAQEFSKGLL